MVDSKKGRSSGRPKTFPKENEKKLKDQIQTLRAKLRQVEKENRIMKEELLHIMKPIRRRRKHIEEPKQTHEIWRRKFLAELKESFSKRQENEGVWIEGVLNAKKSKKKKTST